MFSSLFIQHILIWLPYLIPVTMRAEPNGFKDEESKRAAVPHGLRSTFRDWAASTEQTYEVAERHLAHRIGDKTVEAYSRNQLLRNRAKIMDDYFDFLEGKS